MQLITYALIMLLPVLTAIYTFNYGRWAWRQNLHRGAIGLFILASACVSVPAFVLWWSS